jgi:stage II sporulation protein D
VSDEPLITVGIVDAPRHAIDLLGEFSDPESGTTLSGPSTFRLEGGRILVESGKTRTSIDGGATFHPAKPGADSFVVHDVLIGVRFHWERREDQRFTGSLRLLQNERSVQVINVVPIEEYLASVISSEMSASSSLNLLEAHAIVSRSWLLAQLGRSARQKRHTGARAGSDTQVERIRWYDREDHDRFDVCADDHCQRYQGITKATSPSVRQAIERTRGIVLMHAGEICDARFSKSCGGITEPFETVWEPVRHPYLASVPDRVDSREGEVVAEREEQARAWIMASPDAFCNTNDRAVLSQVLLNYDQETVDFYRWKVEYAQHDLARMIAQKSGIVFGPIVDLIPVERGPSGRLVRLTIVGRGRSMTIGKELEIRRTLSPTHLYSSAFIVEKRGEKDGVPEHFRLTGAGWGHGVGMCQIGAAVMGMNGYTPEQILSHYFRGAALHPRYGSL